MQLPITDFFVLNGLTNQINTVTTKDVFLGKRTVLFMLPGAFTPTCSEQQLPQFEAAYDEIASYGIDQVICVSVNDAFVMRAWGKSLGIEKVQLLPDGNGSFTSGIKGAVAKENLGFGARAWRLAMIVNENGMVEWAGVEDGQRANASDDPYEKSTPQEVIMALRGLELQAAAAAEAEAQALADTVAPGLTK